jgi:hypothetical protein
MQQPRTSDYQFAINDEKCQLGQRKLGYDICSSWCPNGNYYNNTSARSIGDPSTWEDACCPPCSPEEYTTKKFLAINKYFKYEPVTYQPEKEQIPA